VSTKKQFKKRRDKIVTILDTTLASKKTQDAKDCNEAVANANTVYLKKQDKEEWVKTETTIEITIASKMQEKGGDKTATIICSTFTKKQGEETASTRKCKMPLCKSDHSRQRGQ
jgi:hypothetical protein